MGYKEKPLGLRAEAGRGRSIAAVANATARGPLGNGRPFCFAPVNPILGSMPSKKPRPPKTPATAVRSYCSPRARTAAPKR